jgi:hypothetical protein
LLRSPVLGPCALVAVAVALLATTKIRDGDLGFHVKTGERVVTEGRIPRADTFSHTAYGHPWPLHQALPGVVFYAIDRAAGPSGLGALQVLLVTGTYLLVLHAAIRAARRPAWSWWLALLVVVFAVAARPRFLLRPFLFSGLCLALLAVAILRHQQGGGRRWALAAGLVFAAWVNLHAGWVSGVVLLGTQQVGSVAEALRRGSPWRRAIAGRLVVAAAGGLAVGGGLAGLIGNAGLPAIRLPTGFFLDPFFQARIDEFLPLDLRDPATAAPFALAAVALVLGRRKGSLAAILPLLAFALLALSTRRLVFDFSIVAPIAMASLLAASAGERRLGERSRVLGRVPGRGEALATVGVASILFARLSIGGEPSFGFGFQRSMPTAAVRFLAERAPAGEVFNEDAFGGLLLWRSWPPRRVFIDNRLEVYGAPFFRDVYMPIMNAEPGWEDALDRWGVSHLLLRNDPKRVPLLAAAWQSPRWRLVFLDDVAAVFFHATRMPDELRDRTYRLLDPTSDGAYAMTADPRALVEELARAIEAAPESSGNARNLMGLALHRLYGCEAAMPYFRAALDFDPDWRSPRENLEACERYLSGPPPPARD